MVQIEDLIRELEAVRALWGNTCVYVVDMTWGALALNRQSEDEEKSLESVSAAMKSYREDYWAAREELKKLRARLQGAAEEIREARAKWEAGQERDGGLAHVLGRIAAKCEESPARG